PSPGATLFPSTTLFRSQRDPVQRLALRDGGGAMPGLLEPDLAGEVLVGDVLEGLEAREVLHAVARGADTGEGGRGLVGQVRDRQDRKSTRLNSSHVKIS